VFREFRKLAVSGRTSLGLTDLPSLGEIKKAEKDLIWALMHHPEAAVSAVFELEEADLEGLATGEIFKLARALHDEHAEVTPSELVRRLSTVDAQLAQLVTSIGAASLPATPPLECTRAIKRLRCERQHAAIRREIDRLQRSEHDPHQMDGLLVQMRELAHRIEELR